MLVHLFALAGSARTAHGGRARIPSGIFQRLAQYDFDLSIHRAQVVGRPLRQCVVDGRIQPKQHLLSPLFAIRLVSRFLWC